MDEFIYAFEKLSYQLMPILGAVALVCLVIFLIYLIKLMKNLNITINKANETIDSLDSALDKIQQPLNIVSKLSKTVESMHDSSVEFIDKIRRYIIDNIDLLRVKIKKEKRELSQEDLEEYSDEEQ